MSISFDRIASRYDATRGFPPEVDARLSAAFRQVSGLPGGARLLEIGVGTGRIAIPLASAGYRYIGLDISLKMMARLRGRLPPGCDVALVRSDATRLPLRDASVDGAVAVHVFHLIADWEGAIAKLHRVIRPGGALALGFNESDEPALSDQLRERWRAIVHELGGDTRRPGAQHNEVDRLMEATFRPPRREVLATWERRESLRERLDSLASRTNSDTWALPDSTLHESIARAEAWASATYGDLEQQHTTKAMFTVLFYTKTENVMRDT
jgi:ubiquinone/menaquinone biosynthesis C-methylase UbiE